MDYKRWRIRNLKKKKPIKTSVRPFYAIVVRKNYGDVKLFCMRLKHY